MIQTQTIEQSFAKMKKRAEAEGAQVELSLSEGDSFSVSYQDRKMKKYSSSQSQNANIRVLKGKGVGMASTENLDDEALLQSFEAALQSAKDLNLPTDNDTQEELIENSGSYPELNLFHSEYEEVPVDQRLKWAETLEAVALDSDKRITNVPYSGMSLSSGRTWILNSKGLNRSFKQSAINGYSYSIAKENDKAFSGYANFFTRNPKSFNVEATAKEGAQKALSLLGAVQPKTSQMPVLLVNDVAGELLSVLDHHLSAQSLDEGTSLLKAKVGQQVLSDKITLIDDPLRPDLPASRPFDVEGSPSQKTTLFEKGVLKSYLTNSFFARKLGLKNTSNAVRTASGLGVSSSNLCMEPGTKSFDELVAQYPEVLVVTEATGFHSGVKTITGDFSLPSYGFIYRNGKKVAAAEQFVISGNIFEVFRDVAGLSNRLNEDGSSVRAPDVLFEKISVAGEK